MLKSVLPSRGSSNYKLSQMKVVSCGTPGNCASTCRMRLYVSFLLVMIGVSSTAPDSIMPVLTLSMQAPEKPVEKGTEFTITCSLLAATPFSSRHKRSTGDDVRVRRLMLVKQSLGTDNVWRRKSVAACYSACGYKPSMTDRRRRSFSRCFTTKKTLRDYASLLPGVDRGSETIGKIWVTEARDVTILTSDTLRVSFPRSGCEDEGSYACLAEVRYRGQLKTLAGRHVMGTVLTSSAQSCPAQCITFESGCYTVFLEQLTWDRAEARCAQAKGHLVTISSAAENKFVVKLLATRNTALQFFIGLHDRILEGRFQWASLVPSNFRYWSAGQPSSHIDEADCVVISSKSDTWQTAECTTARPFICKRTLGTDPLEQEQTSQQGCPPSWLEHANMCYQFFNESKTYAEASQFCRKLGSQLVEFPSLSHYNYVTRWLGSYKKNVYIGLRDRTGRNVYDRWDSGNPEVVGDWMATNGDTTREQCVQLFRSSDAYHFRDVTCTERLPFVCQRPLLYVD